MRVGAEAIKRRKEIGRTPEIWSGHCPPSLCYLNTSNGFPLIFEWSSKSLTRSEPWTSVNCLLSTHETDPAPSFLRLFHLLFLLPEILPCYPYPSPLFATLGLIHPPGVNSVTAFPSPRCTFSVTFLSSTCCYCNFTFVGVMTQLMLGLIKLYENK